MSFVEDINLDKLLEGVKNLLFVQQDSSKLSDKPIKSTSSESSAISKDYKSPIHGDWHNLGGFDLSMKRADGRTGHQGVDMNAPAGTPVYALSEGVVNKVGTDVLGGNIVGIQHSGGIWSYYAHLSTAKVQEGDKVDYNTVIGTVGNTGNAGNPKDPLKTQEGGRTYPHCHFGVKQNGAWVDPSKFFSIPKYDPNFVKNINKYQKFWLSDSAKQEAELFDMKSHISQKKNAFTNDVEKLLKIATQYDYLIKKYYK